MQQADLFAETDLPEGLRYQPDLISAEEEQQLSAAIAGLPLKEFEFHGFVGKRRVVSFGWRYDFKAGGLHQAEPMPAFLLPVRACAAAFAGVPPDSLQHALVTEYGPGASIGWHKDRPDFGDVIGVSLLSPCTFRLRLKSGTTWRRASLRLEPRSGYLLRGAARTEREHGISAQDQLRYSVTFRTLRARRTSPG